MDKDLRMDYTIIISKLEIMWATVRHSAERLVGASDTGRWWFDLKMRAGKWSEMSVKGWQIEKG